MYESSKNMVSRKMRLVSKSNNSMISVIYGLVHYFRAIHYKNNKLLNKTVWHVAPYLSNKSRKYIQL